MKIYSIAEAEEFLFDEDSFIEYFVYEEEGEQYQILLEYAYLRVSDLNVDIYRGLYCRYSEESDGYDPDHSYYIFKALGTDEIVFSVGYTTIESALLNYSYEMNEGIKNPSNLKCEIVYIKE